MMKRILPVILISLLWAGPVCAEEYAIIKESLFGTQKIEIYKTLEQALDNYKGEGDVYRISREKISIKQVETKKKVEVTEYKWIIDKDTKEKSKAK